MKGENKIKQNPETLYLWNDEVDAYVKYEPGSEKAFAKFPGKQEFEVSLLSDMFFVASSGDLRVTKEEYENA